MAIKPLICTEISHEQALLNNMVCGQPPALRSQLASENCMVTVRPLLLNRRYNLRLTASIDGMDTFIFLNSALFNEVSLGNSRLGDIAESLPEELLVGTLSMVMDRLLGDLRSLLQTDIQLIHANRFNPAEELPAGIELMLSTDSQNSSALMTVNNQTRQWLALLQQQAGGYLPDTLMCPLTLEVGYTVLADTQLRHLATSDVLLFDHCYYQDKTHLFVRLSSQNGFLGRIDGTRVLLEETVENHMSDEFDEYDDDLDEDLDEQVDDGQQAQQAQTASGRDIDGIPVRLVFDVGQQELTLGEARQLQPGFTFELNRDMSSPVTVKANGKPFAECELVQINNQLGARIVRLL